MTELWIQSPRLGNVQALTQWVDALQQVRDYLQVLDPIAQGVAAAAELEARIVGLLQAVGAPRALGILLAEALRDLLEEYLTDGVYVLPYTNLGAVLERTGLSPHLAHVRKLADAEIQEFLAQNPGESSAWPQRRARPQGFTWRGYAQAVQSGLDINRRQELRSWVGALGSQPFNAFADWLNPVCAAFYDIGDPLRPVAGAQDKLGAILLVAQGSNVFQVYDIYLRLMAAFERLDRSATAVFDTTAEAWGKLQEDFAGDEEEGLQLAELLQVHGLKLSLRPHLLPRASTAPDFLRWSTADLLPFLDRLLLEGSNLVEYAGFPVPTDLGLLATAEAVARAAQDALAAFDEVLGLLTALTDVLDLAGVWRLVLPPETGGVDGLVARIQDAPRDDTVRLLTGTITRGFDADGFPRVVEDAFGRILSLPAGDLGAVPGYAGEAVGEYHTDARLAELTAAFDLASLDGFTFSDPQVYRAGDLLRTSEAEALRVAWPPLTFGPPGNLVLAGVALVLVEGPLTRFLLELFSPDAEDEARWLAGEPGVPADRTDIGTPQALDLAPGHGGITPAGGRQDLFELLRAAARLGRGDSARGVEDAVFADNTPAQLAETALGRLFRYGASRSVDFDLATGVQVSDTAPQRTAVWGGQAQILGASGVVGRDVAWTWLVSAIPGRLVRFFPRIFAPTGRPGMAAGTGPFDTVLAPTWRLGTPGALTGAPTLLPGLIVGSFTILPGGVWVESSGLATALDTAGFNPAAFDAWTWRLDLTWEAPGGHRRCVSAWVQEVVGDVVHVSPGLYIPQGATLEGLILSVADDPVAQAVGSGDAVDPATPSQVLHLETAVAFLKRGEAGGRAEALDAPGLVSLLGVDHDHTVDVDTHAWGVQVDVDFTVDDQGLWTQAGGPDVEGPSWAPPVGSWPEGALLLPSSLGDGAEFRPQPRDLASEAASAAEQAPVGRVETDATTDQWRPDPVILGGLWHVLGVDLDGTTRIPLGSVLGAPPVGGFDGAVHVAPSAWIGFRVQGASGTWTEVAAVDALVAVPVDGSPEAGWSNTPDVWAFTFAAPFRAAWLGRPVKLLATPGVRRGMCVPFGRLPDGSAPVHESGDWLVATPLTVRRGWTARGLCAGGGVDPAGMAASAEVLIPGTAPMTRRPAGAGGVLHIRWRSTLAGDRLEGTWELWAGRSHRLHLELGAEGAEFRVQERSLTGSGAWATRKTLATRAPTSSEIFGVTLSVHDGDPPSWTLLVSRSDDGVSWTSLGEDAEALDGPGRPLEGRVLGGGTWTLGRRWEDGAPSRQVLDPFAAQGGVLPGLPPGGAWEVFFHPTPLDEVEEVLDMYR